MAFKLTTRPAETDEDAKAIFRVLIKMHEEVGRAPLNPNKAFIQVYDIVKSQAAFVVEKNGEIVATAGLFLADFWYSDSELFVDKWVYVLPEHRDSQTAFLMLLGEIQKLCDATGIMAKILVFNEKRAKRASGLVADASLLAYYPAGDVVSVHPRG